MLSRSLNSSTLARFCQRGFVALALLLTFFISQKVHAAATVIDLGTLGGTYSAAYGINDNGQVVGESTRAQAAQHAFLYSNGQMQDLGTLEGSVSIASGVNIKGQVVGSSTKDQAGFFLNGFLWSNGSLTNLGTLLDQSLAYAINDKGQIVGFNEQAGDNSTGRPKYSA